MESISQTQNVKKYFLTFFKGNSMSAFLLNLSNFEAKHLKIRNEKIPTAASSIVTENGLIFLIGGETSHYKVLPNTRLFDIENCCLQKRADMKVSRGLIGLATEVNFIYATGGEGNKYALIDVCEKYDITHDKWVKIGSLNLPKRYPSCCILSHKMYVIGGSVINQYLKTIEVLDLLHENAGFANLDVDEESEWKPICNVGLSPISDHEIFIYGGYDGTYQKECFVLDIESQTLQKSSIDLPNKTDFFKRISVLYNAHIYAFNYEKSKMVTGYYKYSISNNQWSFHSLGFQNS